MKKSQKIVFLQALIVTFLIFNLGIFLGYKLESSRINQIDEWYLDAEMELLNQRILSTAFDVIDFDCDALVEENINFGNVLFEKALIIAKYEEANKINNEVLEQHRKYDLLRSLFWVNSLKIKQKCNSNYHTVVYFYQYNNVPLEKDSEQDVFSNFLYNLKKEYEDKVMLIPIAGDNNLTSIDLMMKNYEITELPTILVDEKHKFTDVEKLNDIKQYLN